jgi:GT2 family glycosyltransferase
MNFAIAIATVNRADLLVPTLNKYVQDFPNTEIYVYDNGDQQLPSSFGGGKVFIYNEGNKGVAGAWNFLINKIFEHHQYAIVMNDDVYLGLTEAHIEKFLERNQKEQFITTMYDWSVFVMPKQTWDKVGQFDTNFYPAYCEDSDYEYRMKLLNIDIYKTPEIFPLTYRVSMTTHKEPEKYRHLFAKNKIFYRSKWGGDPGEETFKKPFNNKKP